MELLIVTLSQRSSYCVVICSTLLVAVPREQQHWVGAIPSEPIMEHVLSVSVNDQAVLPCSSAVPTVNWMHQSSLQVIPDEICVNGIVINQYRERFSLRSDAPGQYNLHIANVSLHDAGIYICNVDQGFGDNHYMRLIVTEPTLSVVVHVRQPVVLPCPKSSSATSLANWYYRRSTDSESQQTELVVIGQVVSGFVGRFQLENDVANGNENLVIHTTWITDSGVYICVRNDDTGSRHLLELTVYPDDEVTELPVPFSRNESESSSLHKSADSHELDVAILVLLLAQLLVFITAVVVHRTLRRCRVVLERRGLETAFLRSIRSSNRKTHEPVSAPNGEASEMTRLGGSTSKNYERQHEDKSWRCAFEKLRLSLFEGFPIRDTWDFYEFLSDPLLFHQISAEFALVVHKRFPDVDVVVTPDSHGLIFGLNIASRLMKPFVPVRKLRKLTQFYGDHDLILQEYCSSQGKNGPRSVCMRMSNELKQKKAVIVVEALATGETLSAVVQLLRRQGADVIGCAVVLLDRSTTKALSAQFDGVPIVSMFMTTSTA